MVPDYSHDLQVLATGSALDDVKWPGLLIHIEQRLDQIVHNDFPRPRIPLPDPPHPSLGQNRSLNRPSPQADEPPEKKSKLSSPTSNAHSAEQVETSDTKNGSPTLPRQDPTSQTRGSEQPVSEDTEMKDASSDPSPASLPTPASSLPPQLLTLLRTIQSTLRSNFPTSPPHTSQRLAELILSPKQHYRSLPSYLRALDRIITVASPLSAFPLPTITGLSNGINPEPVLFNGTSPSPSSTPSSSIEENGGSDSTFIGGAELTPIPWLRDSQSPPPPLPSHSHPSHPSQDLRTQSTTQIDGPNGAGSIETVTVSINGVSSNVPAERAREEGLPIAVSQGELIRQEQEAGIAPVPADLNHRHARGLGGLPTSGAAAAAAGVTASATHGDDSGEAGEAGEGQGLADGAEVEEPVHARGPSVIGMEDMGPQTPGSGLQGGIQLEGPMGMRREEPEGLVETGDEGKKDGASKEQTHGETDEAKDSDKKAVTADPDGVVEGEKGKGETGVEKGSDAVDGTTL